MNLTEYYNLRKPEMADPVNINDLNTNAGIIDSALHNLSNKITTNENTLKTKASTSQLNAEISNVNSKINTEINKVKNDLNNNISSINSSLEEKANKNEVFTMANMGQDIKEAMTGGSVAVVGLNAVMVGNLNKNISDSLCEYKTVSLETQNGYYDASLNFVSFSSWRCGEISVSTGDRFIVSGANTNATYNFISIVDKDNNIIDSLAGGVEYTDKEFIIPSGGYKMYISYVYSKPFSLSKADIMKFNSIVNNLSSDVDNLNFNIFNGYKDVSSGLAWVLGGVNGNNGNNSTANYITRVNMFTGDDKEKQFTFNDGYEVGIYVFDNSNTFESYTNYKISSFRYEFLSEKQYKLTFRKSSDTTEITDISDFVSNLSIKDVYDVTTLNPFLKERFGLLEKVKGKTWNPIGDSITAGFLYQPLIVRDTGIICNGNYGVSGSTVAVNANSSAVGQSFYERVVKNTLYPDADIWTIYGGINDMMANTPIGESTSKDSTTFYGALNLIVEYILKLENSPKLLLYNILPSYRDDRTNELGLTMSNYREAITTVGKRYNIRVVQLQEVSGMNSVNRSKFTRDGLHPNEAGTNFYYPCLKNPILDCF